MTVWADLTHDAVFNAVEQTLGRKLSNVLRQRNSYINRVYEVEEHDSRERLIVKFYRPGRWAKEQILEEHAFLAELAAKEVPVIPPLIFNGATLHFFSSMFYALFPKKGGRSLDEFNQEGWQEIGRHVARIHQAGALHRSSTRVTWRPAAATRQHQQTLNASSFLPPDFRAAFDRTIDGFLAKADPLFDTPDQLLLHGDLHKGNLIHRPNEGILIVDFDDACFGPAIQDLWMLLPGGLEHVEEELGWLLKGYETFRPFDRRTLRLVPALRGMRLVHFAAWLAIQSNEPDFGVHFPESGNARYWKELIADLQEVTASL
ncbi:MAG: serine/threonine protein kinase [Candidatus Margulisbacteria bacterium]|jgi:Ser/Thr protein kinase RdoA (MazF antagonist)|nr:serine/threonine protein kinase [Candidatus Margulisiibacteriota bacterium]